MYLTQPAPARWCGLGSWSRLDHADAHPLTLVCAAKRPLDEVSCDLAKRRERSSVGVKRSALRTIGVEVEFPIIPVIECNLGEVCSRDDEALIGKSLVLGNPRQSHDEIASRRRERSLSDAEVRLTVRPDRHRRLDLQAEKIACHVVAGQDFHHLEVRERSEQV